MAPAAATKTPLLVQFRNLYDELQSYVNGKCVTVDGNSLSVAGVTAVARHKSPIALSNDEKVRARIVGSRTALFDRIDEGLSIYGINTGLNGSASDISGGYATLASALVQTQTCGILPSNPGGSNASGLLSLSDPLHTLSMPESWVRAAILVRINGLIRGHSAVRWEALEAMKDILNADIVPVVPLRGSISASGDLTPLSYVCATLEANPCIRVYVTNQNGQRVILPANEALSLKGLKPIQLKPKDHMGILNGTAFSAAVAGLATYEAIQLAMLTEVCVAMSTEALLGSKGSFAPFIHEVACPHPGQIEVATTLAKILQDSKLAHQPGCESGKQVEDDKKSLKQDRYPLRTSPQFIGPQLEDIRSALVSVQQELNASTDNPLADSETGTVHNTGNFQAMAVTNAMEKLRLSLHHLGRILFAQSTELVNPFMNKGLPPSLAGAEPSLDFHCKGLDIGLAAYTSELGYLANPVSTHIQSVEMHNQAINSLALISARATMTAIEVLTMIVSTSIYITCQAFDLRALNRTLLSGFASVVSTAYEASFAGTIAPKDLLQQTIAAFNTTFLQSSTLDSQDRINASSKAAFHVLMEHAFCSKPVQSSDFSIKLATFQDDVRTNSLDLFLSTRKAFLTSAASKLPAADLLGLTRNVYAYVRQKLSIKMHGLENLTAFDGGLNSTEPPVGERVSYIFEAIREGNIAPVLMNVLNSEA